MDEKRKYLLEQVDKTVSISPKEASFYKLFINQFTEEELEQLTDSVVRQQKLDSEEGLTQG